MKFIGHGGTLLLTLKSHKRLIFVTGGSNTLSLSKFCHCTPADLSKCLNFVQ